MYQIFEPVVILKSEKVAIGEGSRIDSFVKIEGGQGVRIGKGVHIASFCHVNIGGGEVVIQDYAAMASGSKIVAGTNTKEGLSMSASSPESMQRIQRSYVVIERFAFLGTNAVVLMGVTIGEGAVIAAGAVVTHDVPPWEIWAGVPAHKIGMREHPLG
jgi:acetyltransferase-like isoleucine patch superfamily enzyme